MDRAIDGYGIHNAQLEDEHTRFIEGTSYRDLSTVMVVPSISLKRTVSPRHAPGVRGKMAQVVHNLTSKHGARCLELATPGIPEAVVFSWLCLSAPPNQIFLRISITNCEVGDAYNQAVQLILDDPNLAKLSFMLTVESDNLPPPMGLIQLMDDIDDVSAGGPFDAVQGLYWGKHEHSTPHCYGKPGEIPQSYRPWVPPPNSLVPVNGVAMGFTLFRISLFKKMQPPWFRTVHEWVPGVGEYSATQDLWFSKQAAKVGAKFAVSSKVRVGHLSVSDGRVW